MASRANACARPLLAGFDFADVAAPVAVAVQVAGAGGLPRSSGLPDTHFAHDGQITKSPVRALTLAARRAPACTCGTLAPAPAPSAWNGVWPVDTPPPSSSTPSASPISAAMGPALLEKSLHVVEGLAPDALAGLAPPAAIFVGVAFNAALFEVLQAVAAPALPVSGQRACHAGNRICWLPPRQPTAELRALSWRTLRPWGACGFEVATRPVVQWSVVL